MNQQRIDEIRARCEAATPAPWNYFYKNKYREHHVSVPIEGSSFTEAIFPDGCPIDGLSEDDGKNAEFIAHAREDIPALLEYIGQLRAENAGLKEQLKKASELTKILEVRK
jgi:hypothetical protein